MFTSGIIIFFGFLFIVWKLPQRARLVLLGWPITVDLLISIIAYSLHWGTFSGVMAAAVAGMLTSLATSGGRWAFGYISGGKYHPGKINVQITRSA